MFLIFFKHDVDTQISLSGPHTYGTNNEFNSVLKFLDGNIQKFSKGNFQKSFLDLIEEFG